MEADFPTRLRECRKKAGLNQEEAGEERERLSFRRGLVLGIKLGALAGR